MYAILNENNEIIQWPLNDVRIKNLGINYDDVVKVKESNRPVHNSLTHYVSERYPEFNSNGELVQNWEVVPRKTEEVRQDLHSRLADYRWRKETSGIFLSDGNKVSTTRESQSQINNTYNALSSGNITETVWKVEDGWITVTLSEFEEIVKSVVEHVEACFAAEKLVSQIIDEAKNVDELSQIEYKSEFRSAYSTAKNN